MMEKFVRNGNVTISLEDFRQLEDAKELLETEYQSMRKELNEKELAWSVEKEKYEKGLVKITMTKPSSTYFAPEASTEYVSESTAIRLLQAEHDRQIHEKAESIAKYDLRFFKEISILNFIKWRRNQK